MVEIRSDPADGLPAIEAGEWAEEKHGLLREYLHCSHGTRRRWLRGINGVFNGVTYIELFAGPGRSFIKGTDTFIDGSPVIAHREAARTDTTFSAMHLGDSSPEFCDAVSARLRRLGAKVVPYPYSAEETVRRIQATINPYAYHFAFLDPFGFDDLPFAIIKTLAGFRYMDVLIHVSAMELQRKLPQYVDSEECSLDAFAPGWREAVRGYNPSGEIARGRVVEHWAELVRNEGLTDAKVKHLIRGQNNQPLYWLALIAKHKLALQFWDSITRRKQPTQDMFAV